ncbi:MAG: hypothetical protein AAB676_02405 [Verrucomicrobiota bacterium]
MKKPNAGTARPKAFAVEIGPSWRRWAKHRRDSELEEINQRLSQLVETFGTPHSHAGLGLRRLRDNAFEFRISRGIRVVFLFFKPNRLQLMMTGDHDEVRAWLKENV